MHPAIGQLLELQRLDQLIAGFRADLETLPKKLKEADAKLNGAKTAVTSSKEVLTLAQTQRRKFEGEVEQWRERAKKYRAQSASVKTNEAYKALQHEIATADGEAGKAEDLVLEQMMGIEEAERRVKHFEADLREAEQAVSTEKKRIEAQYGDEKKKLDVATAERAEISGKAPAELVELYTRVAKRHPGTAMAEVRDGQCKGCGLRILPHVIQMLTTEADEEVFRCESCGRILFTLEPIPHAAPPADSEASAANGASHS
jgi:uncharacterized protein